MIAVVRGSTALCRGAWLYCCGMWHMMVALKPYSTWHRDIIIIPRAVISGGLFLVDNRDCLHRFPTHGAAPCLLRSLMRPLPLGSVNLCVVPNSHLIYTTRNPGRAKSRYTFTASHSAPQTPPHTHHTRVPRGPYLQPQRSDPSTSHKSGQHACLRGGPPHQLASPHWVAAPHTLCV